MMTTEPRIVYTTIASPVGELLAVGEPTASGGMALTSVTMPGQPNAPTPGPGWREAPELFGDVAAQLRAYFAGELTRFTTEFAPTGTDFQRRVWTALEAIPYGTCTTYGALTTKLGLPSDRVQAVAGAVAANPALVVRPCHRVIGTDGSMRGYAGGVERKVQLLTHEGALPPALIAPPEVPSSRGVPNREPATGADR